MEKHVCFSNCNIVSDFKIDASNFSNISTHIHTCYKMIENTSEQKVTVTEASSAEELCAMYVHKID